MVVLGLSACTPTVSDSGLYWGRYSNTLYAFKKNPGPDTRAKHIDAIRDVIANSKEKNLRVPPGLYAELGMYMIEDGKKAEGDRLMNLEMATYPESKQMVEQVLKKTQKKKHPAAPKNTRASQS